MNFTSYDFLLFFLVVFILYWLAGHRTLQNVILLIASYVFYGWLHPWYAVLLGASTLGDYGIGLALEGARDKRRWVWASLLLNVGVLAFFKYFHFFAPQVTARLVAWNWPAWWVSGIVLPVGLSFFTLKKLAYILDVAQGVLRPARNLIEFALFVAFFPQITAGPIDRAQKLLPQFQVVRRWRGEYFYQAWPLLVMGFFKKFVIANSLAPTVSRIFHLSNPSGELALAAALGFTLQILADFSGYTDISRGLAYLFGIETSENFRSPYLALTPSEFWNRWHISLSTWLRDYIFFPLRRFLLRRYAHLPGAILQAIPPIITMAISGLWHGAGWNYLAWGLLYGVAIAVYQSLGLRGDWRPQHRVGTFLAWLVMFSLTVFAFLLFAAPSLAWVAHVFRQPFFGSIEQQAVALVTFSLTAVYSIPLLLKKVLDRFFQPASWAHSMYYALATLAMIVYINSQTPDFIYFQF